jgi:hypothetical protein
MEQQSGINGQDLLSSWRAYGSRDRGVCLSFESQHFITFSKGAIGFRLSRVIYDSRLQEKIVDELLHDGYKLNCTKNDQRKPLNALSLL